MIGTKGRSIVSSALQERNGFAGVGLGSAWWTTTVPLGTPVNQHRHFFRQKVLALHCFASALRRGLGNQSVFPPVAAVQAGGGARVDVSYFAQIPGRQWRRPTNDRNSKPKVSVVNSS